MPKRLKDPIKRLNELSKNTSRIIIGLAGLPGAGKSTLTKQWSEKMGDKIAILSMDGFHYYKSELRNFPDPEKAFARKGAPWTFNSKSFVDRVKQLKEGKVTQWPDFKHGGDPIEDAFSITHSANLILIEGLYLLYRENDWNDLQYYLDETWFLDTPEPLAQSRVISRHMKSANLSLEEATLKAQSNDLLNGKLVLNTKDKADYLIDPVLS